MASSSSGKPPAKKWPVIDIPDRSSPRHHDLGDASHARALRDRDEAGGQRRVSRLAPLPAPIPTSATRIGVSPRPGQGYDLSRFQERPVQYSPLLAAREPAQLRRGASQHEQIAHRASTAAFADNLSQQRMDTLAHPEGPRAGMKQAMAGMHGLFLPGDSNRNMTQTHSPGAHPSQHLSDANMREPVSPTDIRERATRDPFEQEATRHARNTGMPTLAVCGGSWRVLAAYGGSVETIPENNGRDQHQGGLSEQKHDLAVDPHSHLGAAVRHEDSATGSVRGVNSTHWAMATARDGQLQQRHGAPNERHDPVAPQELQISAVEPRLGHPEGFESRHGAPIVGIQAHPEYFLTRTKEPPTEEFGSFSTRLFTNFEQASTTYARKQSVNEEIRQRVAKIPAIDR